MNIFELREKSLKIAHEARDLIASTDVIDGETTAKIERMLAESDGLEARAKQLESIEAREKAFDQSAQRAPVETVEARTSAPTADEQRAKAFNEYLRGDAGERELRALGVGTSASGGYTVPTGFVGELIEAMKAYGPLNEGGPVEYRVTATGNPFTMPKLDDTSNKGSQIAENTEVSEASLTFGQLSFGAYKYTSGVVLISRELLQDSGIDIEQEVADAMAERMGRILNDDFTIGAGTSGPQGIVTGASAGVTAASATAVAFDDLIKLEHSVDPAYRIGAGYMFNDSTKLAMRLLKDTMDRPLWQPSYQVGGADTFNGRPFWINQSMASIGAGNVSVLFGDFSKFTVRRVREFGVTRLNERYATADQVGFVGFGRYDSKVRDSRAIKKLVH